MKSHSRYKGIQYLDLNSYDSSKNLLILMHPFFENAPSEKYIKNIKYFMSNYDGPILIMDDEISYKNTTEWVENTFPFSARYFIKTKPCSNELDYISNKKLYSFLKEVNDNKPVGLMGGYYNGCDSDSIESGCLGSLEFLLNKNKFETYVIERCTFSLR